MLVVYCNCLISIFSLSLDPLNGSLYPKYPKKNLPSNLIHLRQWLLDWNIKCATQSTNELSSSLYLFFNVLKNVVSLCKRIPQLYTMLDRLVFAMMNRPSLYCFTFSKLIQMRVYLDRFLFRSFSTFIKLFFFFA